MSEAVPLGDAAAVPAALQEHHCAQCSRTFSGEAVSNKSYVKTPMAITPARLGHVCSECGAVSCDKCKKAGIGWSGWSGYEKAVCQSCGATMDKVNVVVGGSGNLCRAYGGEQRQPVPDPGNQPREKFRVNTGWETTSDFLWGAVILGGTAAMYFLLIRPSQNSSVQVSFKYPYLVPLAVLAAGWWIYRGIVKNIRAARGTLVLDNDGVHQRGVMIGWNEIRRATLLREGDGVKPALVLNADGDRRIQVAWGTRRIEYVANAIIGRIGRECELHVR